MGLNPNLWGYHQWMILHLMAFNFPDNPTDEDKLAIEGYVGGMARLLPCPGCSWHCQAYVQDHPINAESKKDLFAYFVEMHNDVNRRLGKREYTYTEVWSSIEQNYVWIVNSIVANRSQDIRKEDHNLITSLVNEKTKTKVNYHSIIQGYIIILLICCLFVFCIKRR